MTGTRYVSVSVIIRRAAFEWRRFVGTFALWAEMRQGSGSWTRGAIAVLICSFSLHVASEVTFHFKPVTELTLS